MADIDISRFAVQRDAGLPTLARALGDADFFRSVLDGLGDAVYLVDRRRRIRFWNQACQEISGYSPDEVIGRPCYDGLLRHVDSEGQSMCHTTCPLAATMADGDPRTCRIWMHHKDGQRVPVSVRTRPLRDADGRIIGGIEVFSDDSALAATEDRVAELEQAALADALTALPNRRYAEIALASRLAELRRHGFALSVAFIDVDHFKRVNDDHGHDAGDAVLRMVAKTLAANVRTSDVVARFGGEEFVVLLQHASWSEVTLVCERLRMMVEHASLAMGGGPPLRVTVSLGATAALPDDTPDSVLRRADALLYASKRAGRNRVTTG